MYSVRNSVPSFIHATFCSYTQPQKAHKEWKTQAPLCRGRQVIDDAVLLRGAPLKRESYLPSQISRYGQSRTPIKHLHSRLPAIFVW